MSVITGKAELQAKLRDVIKLIQSTAPMTGIVTDGEKIIRSKTAAGKDYRGAGFHPYSDAYAKRKGSTRVNLRLSGSMLRALKSKALSPLHGIIRVMPEPEPGTKAKTDMIAQIHSTGTGRQPQREFMNITPSALQNLVKKHYDDEIMKILGRG